MGSSSTCVPRGSRRLYLGLALSLALATGGAPRALAQDDALEGLRAQAQSRPRDAVAQRDLALALLRTGRLDEAERTFRKAQSLQRGSVEASYDVLRVTFERGDHRKARGACAQLKNVAAGTPWVPVCMARAFLIWQRSSRAVEYVQEALAIDANHPEALLALGDAERVSGNYDEAARAYQRVRELSGDPEAELGLARVEMARGNPQGAVSLLRSVIARVPSWPSPQLELGRLLEGEEGLSHLQRAVALRPAWDQAELALGEALMRAGRAADAERAAAGVVGRNPQLAEAHTLLARAQQAQGNTTGAEQALTQALTLVPNLPEATLARADLYAATERNEEAFAEYQKAAGLRPLDAEPLLRAARLGLQLQRFALAAAFLDRALDRNAELAEALALYGDVMAARGDRADARTMYQRALRGQGKLDRARVEAALRGL